MNNHVSPLYWIAGAYIIYAVWAACYMFFWVDMTTPAQYIGTPADPATFMPSEMIKENGQLNKLRHFLFLLNWPLNLVILAMFFVSGLAVRCRKRVSRFPIWIQSGFIIFFMLLVMFVVKLPLRLLSYSISRHYGISVQPLGDWLIDSLIRFGLDFLQWAIILSVALFVISRVRHWWLVLWGLAVPGVLFLFFIQPLWIDPLFHEIRPLQNKPLEQNILSMAEQSGIAADEVYEVEMSVKTNAMNAYVNGLGPSLRIVMWDTLLERMDEREVLFIMAHEMGHYVMNHLNWSAFGIILGAGLMLYLLQYVYSTRFKYKADPSALPLLFLLLITFQFLAGPIEHAVSRQAEAQADRFAYALTEDAEAGISSKQKLALASKSDLHPPRLIQWLRYSHPSLGERIYYLYEKDLHR